MGGNAQGSADGGLEQWSKAFPKNPTNVDARGLLQWAGKQPWHRCSWRRPAQVESEYALALAA